MEKNQAFKRFLSLLLVSSPLHIDSSAWRRVCLFCAVDKIRKSGSNPERGSHKETMKVVCTANNSADVNKAEVGLVQIFYFLWNASWGEPAKARSARVHEFNLWPYQPPYSMCEYTCLRCCSVAREEVISLQRWASESVCPDMFRWELTPVILNPYSRKSQVKPDEASRLLFFTVIHLS